MDSTMGHNGADHPKQLARLSTLRQGVERCSHNSNAAALPGATAVARHAGVLSQHASLRLEDSSQFEQCYHFCTGTSVAS